MFGFAHPQQVLTAINTYAGDHYGAMLYDLYDDKSTGQYYRCWGTLVKLTWGLPRSTHRYFVNNLLASEFTSIRTKIISRYVKFFQNLLRSASKEVRLIAQLAAQDRSSTTGSNLAKIRAETNLNPWNSSAFHVKEVLLDGEPKVPEQDLWRLPYLSKLMEERHSREMELLNKKEIDHLIDTLCSS